MPQAMLWLSPAVSGHATPDAAAAPGPTGVLAFPSTGAPTPPLRGASKTYRNYVVHFEWPEADHDATICQFYWGRGWRGQMVQYCGALKGRPHSPAVSCNTFRLNRCMHPLPIVFVSLMGSRAHFRLFDFCLCCCCCCCCCCLSTPCFHRVCGTTCARYLRHPLHIKFAPMGKRHKP
jgi:hypothetical protein